MQNKATLFISIFAVVAIFIALTIFQKNSQNSATLEKLENNSDVLVRDYSIKHGENGKNVTVVEFLDPECGSCAIFHPVLKKLYKDYYKDIQIVTKYLDNHKNSALAIKLLEASRVQDRYFEVLDLMFEKHNSWASHDPMNENFEYLFELLKAIPNLDIEKLKVDMKDPKIDEIIAQDRKDATTLGVRGTPTIFVNGALLKTLSTKALFDMVEGEIYK